jgi:hypothetical protein
LPASNITSRSDASEQSRADLEIDLVAAAVGVDATLAEEAVAATVIIACVL